MAQRRADCWLVVGLSLMLVWGLTVYGTVRLTMAFIGPPPLAKAKQVSKTVVDRNGDLLRAFTNPQGRWRLPVELDEVDPRYIAILLAFEDRRFKTHGAV